jgi:hypothetical protein
LIAEDLCSSFNGGNVSQDSYSLQFSDFLRGFRLMFMNGNREALTNGVTGANELEEQTDQVKLRVQDKQINCVLRDIEFQSQKMHIYLFIDITIVEQ